MKIRRGSKFVDILRYCYTHEGNYGVYLVILRAEASLWCISAMVDRFLPDCPSELHQHQGLICRHSDVPLSIPAIDILGFKNYWSVPYQINESRRVEYTDSGESYTSETFSNKLEMMIPGACGCRMRHLGIWLDFLRAIEDEGPHRLSSARS